jgi:hypothetical protein
MARQIAEGYTLVTAVTLKRLEKQQLKSLEFELDKELRSIRAEAVDLSDLPTLQMRNRRISRIDGALRVIRGTLQTRARKGG